MANGDFFYHPEHWRERAQERLAMARHAKEPQDRERLLKVAVLRAPASRTQDWKRARESQQSQMRAGDSGLS
jgi:hypothetical protein